MNTDRAIPPKAFIFGSVPLKTYLPHGDINLTAFCKEKMEAGLAAYVHAFLEREKKKKSAEFIVWDVQYINAEVKLIECMIEGIHVGISFNQLDGLRKLCLFEQVDRLIGNHHLFKRSIILIKAWCYYKSRILGARHGLLSTYAVETMVLYIFQLFNSSLSDPLMVLHKFLHYYQKFDWDNYCISLNGPVCVSSLPEIIVEKPESKEGQLLLVGQNLMNCVGCPSVPHEVPKTKAFLSKHLNIIDPIRENNNLGESVTEGNFYRIRSAISRGARDLGHILSLSEEKVANEICKYFSNDILRNGRPDVQCNTSNGSSLEVAQCLLDLGSDYETHYNSLMNGLSFSS